MIDIIPSVSIIVPIYNVEKYLNRCVDSLLGQSLNNIEIILVDDGSTDESGKIADKYLELDSRVKVIHKENGGLSSARNAGMDIATGEYVGFVDSDDWVRNDMYEKLYTSAVKYQSDMVMTGFYREYESGTVVENPLILSDKYYENEEVIDKILIPMIGADSNARDDIEIDMCVWRNIYRSDLLKENNIQFISERLYISEDIVFHLEVFRYVKSVSVVKDFLYYYTVNVQSLTQVYKADRFNKECILFEYVRDRLYSLGLYEKSIERFKRAFIGRARVCIIKEARDNFEASILKRISNIRKITKNEILSDCLKDYPIRNYLLKQKVVAYCMKYHFAVLLFICAVKHKRH